MELMLSNWLEIESNGCACDCVGGDRIGELVTFCRGGSMMCGGIVMF